MALIDHIDGISSPRRIYLSASTINTSFHPIDLYKEMRSLRRTDESLRAFDVFMSAFGNVSKGSGKFTERYVRLNNCVLVPYDSDQTITVTGTIISDSGVEGVLVFDTSLLSPNTTVNINYVPPQVEVITVATGSGVLEQDKIDIINGTIAQIIAEYGTDFDDRISELWVLLGLDSSSPMTVTPTSRTAGSITQTITGDGETSSTVTRI